MTETSGSPDVWHPFRVRVRMAADDPGWRGRAADPGLEQITSIHGRFRAACSHANRRVSMFDATFGAWRPDDRRDAMPSVAPRSGQGLTGRRSRRTHNWLQATDLRDDVWSWPIQLLFTLYCATGNANISSSGSVTKLASRTSISNRT